MDLVHAGTCLEPSTHPTFLTISLGSDRAGQAAQRSNRSLP